MNKKISWLFAFLFTISLIACGENKRIDTSSFTMQPVQQSLHASIEELDRQVGAIEDGVKELRAISGKGVDIEQPVKAIENAVSTVKIVSLDLKTIEKRISELAKEVEAIKKDYQSVVKELNSEKERRIEAEKKYHDAWFGGKFWRTFYWVLGIGTGLLILGLILNAKTDIFLLPVKAIGWLFKH